MKESTAGQSQSSVSRVLEDCELAPLLRIAEGNKSRECYKSVYTKILLFPVFYMALGILLEK